jgi:SAM-dependent methyltransferase
MSYVHGYSVRESVRLVDQATSLSELLHCDTRYPDGSRVLEAGCGVGAQTILLSRNSPGARFTSIDLSQTSLEAARAAVDAPNVQFQRADLFALPFQDEAFDHVFVCFVLEHLRDPLGALRSLKRVLKKGGSITVIEGDHGSTYFHPRSELAQRTIQCLIELQAQPGGDSLIGRRLYPLVKGAGFAQVSVSPRMVYVDSSKPALVEGFTRNTFNAMVEGVREEALRQKLMSEADWDRGIADLHAAEGEDGTFCYTFFKATALR